MTTVRVLKYPIPIDDQWHDVPLPRNQSDKPCEVGIQDSVVMVWTVPTEDAATERMKVVGTGHYWDARNVYLGSVQDRGFVWHVISGGHE